MKTIKLFSILTAICSLCVILCLNAFAMNTGMKTQDVTESRAESILSNINLHKSTNIIADLPIECFDVNEDGFVAIGFANYSKKYINVYSTDGEFQYGYVFDSEGSFALEWDNENIIIYFARSSVLISFDKDANFIEMKEATNDFDNNTYMNHKLFAKKIEAAGAVYTLEHSIKLFNFLSSNAAKIVCQKNGTESVVLTMNDNGYNKMVLKNLLWVLFSIVAVIIMSIKQFLLGNAMLSKKNMSFISLVLRSAETIKSAWHQYNRATHSNN